MDKIISGIRVLPGGILAVNAAGEPLAILQDAADVLEALRLPPPRGSNRLPANDYHLTDLGKSLRSAMLDGRKIDAIKMLRAAVRESYDHNLSLREWKDIVEMLCTR